MRSAMTRVVRGCAGAVLATLVALCGVAVKDASARAVGGAAGRAVPSTDESCFQPYWNAVTNTCSGDKSWDIPLATDGKGSKNVNISGYAASESNQVSCVAVSRNKGNTTGYASSWKSLPSTGVGSLIALSVYVDQDWQLYANCIVKTGGWINTVNWTK